MCSHLPVMSGTVTIGKVRLVDEYISDQIDGIGQEQLAGSGRMTAVEQTVALSTRVTTAESDIAALEAKDVTLASAATALSNRVTTAERDISALEAKDVALAAATSSVSSSLASALARITVIETHFADTRKTFNLYNHRAGKYLDDGGNLTATKESTNAHYSITHD